MNKTTATDDKKTWNKKEKGQQATSLEEAKKLLERDFFVKGPSGIVYQIDMLNQAAYAKLMAKMEGDTQSKISEFVVQNMVLLGKDILPDIVIKPKIGPGGLSADKIPPSDINIILGAFISGPTTKGFLEEDESFRD